jgi:hypothetical protein
MKTKLLTILTLLVLCVTGAWGDGTAISSLNFSAPTTLPSAYTYSSTNSPVIVSDVDKTSVVNVNNGGNSGVPTFSSDNSAAPTGGKRWMAFQPAENCTVTFRVRAENDNRVFYIWDKDHAATNNCVSSFTAASKNTWYNTWTVNLTAGTWYAIGGSGSKCYINSMTFTAITSYAITWYAGGHGTAPTSPTSASTFTLPQMTADGYINTGWTADKAVTVGGESVSAGTEIEVGTSVTLTDATAFTGVWEEAVDEAPTVTAATSSTDVRAGAEVTLTATPTGYPVPTLQWYSCDSEGGNQSVIDDATSTTYQPSTSTLGVGTFHFLVKASNSVQSDVASNVVSVKIYDAGTSGTASDLVAVPDNYVFVADDITINGTSSPSANTLYDGSKVFTSTKFSVSTGTGSNTFGGSSHLNSMRLKNTSDYVAFKVSGPCTVTFYGNSYSGRNFKIGTNANDDTYGTFSGDNTSQEFNIPNAGTVYITGSGSDRYLAGFVVAYAAAPSIKTQPVGATYNLNEAATALTIEAEPYTEGKALSYQWYSNTTNSTVGATAIVGATSTSYTPSTTTGGTTYYYCVVSEEDNDETTTSEIVAIKVVDLGELIVTLQPATIPSGDTAYPSNTFSANGFTLAASNANFWNSVLAKYPRIFKAQKDVTFTITAPSYATIKSIKILGTSNNDDNTASIDAGSGATAVTSTTLKKRKDYTDSDNPELSEVILAVDAPSAGNSISFTTKSQQVRFYVEIYGTGTAPDQNISATKEYSTFCSAYDLDFTNVDGLEAYVVSAINESSATISKVNKVPASTGLILKKTANIGTASNFSVSVPTSTDDMGTNNMVGVLADTDMTSVENAYILSNGKFYECNGGTLAAGKAYLVAAAWASGDAREYSIVVDGSDDHTTSIDSINTQHPSTDSQRYNLAGQKVSENYKGIVIVNGKKYINK